MEVFVALLRAVNVGGTGKLAMAELASLCVAEGLGAVRTVGASGNAVFRGELGETATRDRLRARLRAQTGRDVGVIVRSSAEIDQVLECNPFPDSEPARVMALFFDGVMPDDPLAGAVGHVNEEVRRGPRALFVFYPSGAGSSRLRLLLADRNRAQHEHGCAACGDGAQDRIFRVAPPCFHLAVVTRTSTCCPDHDTGEAPC